MTDSKKRLKISLYIDADIYNKIKQVVSDNPEKTMASIIRTAVREHIVD